MTGWLYRSGPGTWQVRSLDSSFRRCCWPATRSSASQAICAISVRRSFPASWSSFAMTGASGLWNLVFLAGVLIGGFLASHFGPPQVVNISPRPYRHWLGLAFTTFPVWRRRISSPACPPHAARICFGRCRRIPGWL